MCGGLARSVELVNETSPGVDIELTEVERVERQGRVIVSLRPGERRKIRGTQFINRHRTSSTPRCLHATVKLPGDEPPLILAANDLAVNGKLKFRLVEGRLSCHPEVISNFRRLR